jgi:hypothetical protein
MKKLTFVLIATFSLASHAGQYSPVNEAEISKNRACFQDLEVYGCGKLEEDKYQFRTCLSEVQDSLSQYCKNMMQRLYGN